MRGNCNTYGMATDYYCGREQICWEFDLGKDNIMDEQERGSERDQLYIK